MRMILISHGEFSKGALHAATMIIGECDKVSAVGLMPDDDMNSMSQKIENEIVKNNAQDEDIIILSDLRGGSPFNSAVMIMSQGKYKIHHVTGMNLPMIIEAVSMLQSDDDVNDIIASCLETGKEGVVDANALFGM